MKPPIDNFKNKLYPNGSITQWFGENPGLYQNAMGINGHNGIDIVAPWGSPIYAVEGGVVVDAKDSPDGFGMHLRIITDGGNEWTYGHNSKHFVKVGDRVEAGQHIANMGNTGFVISGATPFWKHNPYAGTHLHLGLRKVKFTNSGWQYNPNTPRIEVLNYDNGYKGAIDFSLEDVSEIEEKKKLMLTVISLQNQFISLLKQFLAK